MRIVVYIHFYKLTRNTTSIYNLYPKEPQNYKLISKQTVGIQLLCKLVFINFLSFAVFLL